MPRLSLEQADAAVIAGRRTLARLQAMARATRVRVYRETRRNAARVQQAASLPPERSSLAPPMMPAVAEVARSVSPTRVM